MDKVFMKSVRIAAVPQGSTHRYWKAVHAGVNKAAHDLKAHGVTVDIAWKGPWREGNHEEQIEIVRGFIKSDVKGIVLAPFNSRALVAPVEEAASAGIPTIVIDSALDSLRIVSFIASDNEKAGAVAADRMAGLLGGKGTVLLLRYEASADLVARHAEQIQGIFTTNESSTAGMLMALQSMQKAGKMVLVGFDSSDVYLDAMRYKQLHGLVVQDPFRMGELAVKTIVDHLDGKPVQKRVDTGVTMVTPENMDTPDAKRLLHPPLAEYL